MLTADEQDSPKAKQVTCCVPGCPVTEPAVGVETCLIWDDRRLCYAAHFPDFSSSPLADVCSDRGSGPTDKEWSEFLTWSKEERAA